LAGTLIAFAGDGRWVLRPLFCCGAGGLRAWPVARPLAGTAVARYRSRCPAYRLPRCRRGALPQMASSVAF